MKLEMNSLFLDYYNIRIIQRNLVYVIGISQKYAEENILRRYEFFSQFGTITKIIINKRGVLSDVKGLEQSGLETTASAYITYSSPLEAKWCIEEVDESLLDGKILRCTYGTTKYCSFYLKGVLCQNNECMYLHTARPTSDILTKEELVNTKHKLHCFESKNKNRERIGNIQKFEFIEELIKCKHDVVFNPPKNILFEPMDFSQNMR